MFKRVLSFDELWGGELTAARLDGVKLLLVRMGDEVHAYEDRCAHLGFELSRGRLDGHVLTCAAHEWKYDVVTGGGINPKSACLKRFAVKVENGGVFVDLASPDRRKGPGDDAAT